MKIKYILKTYTAVQRQQSAGPLTCAISKTTIPKSVDPDMPVVHKIWIKLHLILHACTAVKSWGWGVNATAVNQHLCNE